MLTKRVYISKCQGFLGFEFCSLIYLEGVEKHQKLITVCKYGGGGGCSSVIKFYFIQSQ